eukprot:TRINITY_DN202_c0_g1_i2.p1 TRINITY_DN202_c0_g1~~TRINITY_DN202_c0_g1_i2.p1  ORF type:complete len:666 (+),score=120.42 TRINITY_DN202_c0_g1_i2:192-2000(+)
MDISELKGMSQASMDPDHTSMIDCAFNCPQALSGFPGVPRDGPFAKPPFRPRSTRMCSSGWSDVLQLLRYSVGLLPWVDTPNKGLMYQDEDDLVMEAKMMWLPAVDTVTAATADDVEVLFELKFASVENVQIKEGAKYESERSLPNTVVLAAEDNGDGIFRARVTGWTSEETVEMAVIYSTRNFDGVVSQNRTHTLGQSGIFGDRFEAFDSFTVVPAAEGVMRDDDSCPSDLFPSPTPTSEPTPSPTSTPTSPPTSTPTTSPSGAPTTSPTLEPSQSPSRSTTPQPTSAETPMPTPAPVSEETPTPTSAPDSGEEAARCANKSDAPNQCDRLDGCYHDGVACVPAKESGCELKNGKKTQCEKLSGCYWKEEGEQCVEGEPESKCAQKNGRKAQCKNSAGCEWQSDGGLCVEGSETPAPQTGCATRNGKKTQCKKASMCTWQADGELCVESDSGSVCAAKNGKETQCKKLDGCTWKIDTALCVDGISGDSCSKLNGRETQCENRDGCVYNHGTRECSKGVSGELCAKKNGKAQQCKALGCVYNSTSMLCEHKDEDYEMPCSEMGGQTCRKNRPRCTYNKELEKCLQDGENKKEKSTELTWPLV